MLVAMAVGAATPWLPTESVLVVAAVLLTAAAIAVARRSIDRRSVVGRWQAAGSAADEDRAHAQSESNVQRLPRALFYGGLATVGVPVATVGSVNVSDVLFLGALAGGAAEALLRRERIVGLPAGLIVGTTAFTVGSVLSSVVASMNPAASLGVVARVDYLFLAWFAASAVVLRRAEHVVSAMSWWVASAAISSVWAVGQRLSVVPIGPDEAGGRVAGLMEHVNDLGILCAIALIPAVHLAWRRRTLWSVVAAGAVGAGLALSGSVGAALAGGAAVIVAATSRDLAPAMRLGLLVAAVVLAGAAASGTLEGTQFTRFSDGSPSAVGNAQGTLQTRIDVFAAAFDRVERSPFIGVGLDPQSSELYSPTSGSVHAVHNLFLGRWYESGFLGLLGIVLVVVTLLRLGWRAVGVATTRVEGTVSIVLLASVSAFVVVSLSEPLLYRRFALVPAALVVSLWGIQRRRASVGIGSTAGPHHPTTDAAQ
ncbi:O-antigen ligase family protein [Patulibacter sp. S7RM1-6]